MVAVALSGCAGHELDRPLTRPPAAVVVGCDEGGTGRLAREARNASVTAGPLALVGVRAYAGYPPRAFGSAARGLRRDIIANPMSSAAERERARSTVRHAPPGGYGIAPVLVSVTRGQAATLAVTTPQLNSVSLVYSRRARNTESRGAAGIHRVGDGDPSVHFGACADADTHFPGGIIVAGARCAKLDVTSAGQPSRRLRLAFGAGSCEAQPHRLLAARPYLGVACAQPNSIACDRVGLDVQLRAPARSVTATVAGRRLRLRSRRPTHWQGFLRPAGLLDGPLKVTPDRGRHHWYGRHARHATVRIVVEPVHGDHRAVSLRLGLHPGWG